MICDIAGEQHDRIARILSSEFGTDYVRHVRGVYDSANFVAKRWKEDLAWRQSHKLDVDASIEKLRASSSFFSEVNRARSVYVHRIPTGEHGGFHNATKTCLHDTASAVAKQAPTFFGTKYPSLSFSGSLDAAAFLSEAAVEHSFGNYQVHGTTRMRNMEEYGRGKYTQLREYIKRSCQTKFPYFTGQTGHYARSVLSDVDASELLELEARTFATISRQHMLPVPVLSSSESSVMKAVSAHIKSHPSNTRRDFQRNRCGYAPTIIITASEDVGGRELPKIFIRAVEARNFVDVEVAEGIRSRFWVMRGDVLFAPPKELI